MGIDYLYHGDTKSGILLSSKDLQQDLMNKSMFLGCIHFGAMVYQPVSRFLYSKSKDDYKRFKFNC